jgi:hypothetical protein
MAGLRLDGAGTAKMVTLEEAATLLQRIHGLVEQYALSVKQAKPGGTFLNKLKGQFGMISDLVTATNMQMTRGSSDPIRVRSMREGVASIKVQLDIAIAQTIAKHQQHD